MEVRDDGIVARAKELSQQKFIAFFLLSSRSEKRNYQKCEMNYLCWDILRHLKMHPFSISFRPPSFSREQCCMTILYTKKKKSYHQNRFSKKI